jgi:hypothetical protein
MHISPSRKPNAFQHVAMKKLIWIMILDLALVCYSLIRFPAAGVLHALPVMFVLIVYGLGWAWSRFAPRVQYWGIALGILAGMVLGGEVILEYLLLPANNTLYGVVEYSLFLLLMVLAGMLVYREISTLKVSAQAGLLTGMIGSLIWYGVLLLVFHLFFGSLPQAQVFQAEGNLEDFSRSGMTDLTTFIVQDFLGAGFFHLLLGAIFGAVFGFIGGIVWKIIPPRNSIPRIFPGQKRKTP